MIETKRHFILLGMSGCKYCAKVEAELNAGIGPENFRVVKVEDREQRKEIYKAFNLEGNKATMPQLFMVLTRPGDSIEKTRKVMLDVASLSDDDKIAFFTGKKKGEESLKMLLSHIEGDSVEQIGFIEELTA